MNGSPGSRRVGKQAEADRTAAVLSVGARLRLDEAELLGSRVREVLQAAGGPTLGLVEEAVAAGLTKVTPRWDVVAHELWWAGRLVNRFRNDAANRKAVLDEFEGQGWPSRITDPIPRVAGLSAKNRRRETIRSLNLGLVAGTIRFFLNGSAQGIWWGVLI